ncbi:DUF5086 family protein [Rhizobium sp. H4]|uniref:DUF5086 family protein n=1 Tax=Rhizobium sp. H4 TaxID=2035449 RepID=UPI001FDFBC06|nr:DUF5086 family protein [Rhizobium sp. H4]
MACSLASRAATTEARAPQAKIPYRPFHSHRDFRPDDFGARRIGGATDHLRHHSLRLTSDRWATVHKAPDPGEDDPYYHVEVIEKERRAPPWQFKRLTTHVVVTADASNRSRSRQKARTYFYKDIEFRIAYQNWRAQPRLLREAGVCRTTILECVGLADKRD